MELAAATSPAVDEGGRFVLLVPLGSTEQHGPHLPLDTDSTVAAALARRSAERLRAAFDGPVWVAPTVPYGASGEHAGFAGTVSIGTDALVSVLVEIARSTVADRLLLVFVNGHGGNHHGLATAVAQLRREGHDVVAVSPVGAGDAHAGDTETSIMLYLAPESVRHEEIVVGNTEPLSELLPTLVREGVLAVSPNGILGDPRPASRSRGEALVEEMVAQVTATVVEHLESVEDDASRS